MRDPETIIQEAKQINQRLDEINKKEEIEDVQELMSLLMKGEKILKELEAVNG